MECWIWAERLVFRELAPRLAKGVDKPKPTPICPFLFHLYDSQGLLTEEEDLDYQTAQELAGYRIQDRNSRPESEDEGRADTPVASPVREELVQIPNRRRKHTYRAPQGSRPVQSRGEGSWPQPDHPQPERPQPERAQPERPQPE